MDKVCFEAVANEKSKALVLGSFPSEKSLKVNFYYGNKSNRFWKVLAEYFNEKIGESIDEKKTVFACSQHCHLGYCEIDKP